jgi:hypothetical protein
MTQFYRGHYLVHLELAQSYLYWPAGHILIGVFDMHTGKRVGIYANVLTAKMCVDARWMSA